MKRILSVCMVIALVLMLIPFAQADEVPTLTVAVAANTFVEDYETNEFTKMLEDAVGVNLDFQVWSEPTTKLSLLVGSNSQMTDIICFSGLDNTTIFKYGSSGVFLPLNEYYENPELAVHFNQIDESARSIILDSTKCADGKIYSMSKLGEYFPNNICHHLIINVNWLDQLNMSIPTTTDELREVLVAFKENDLNGNGKQDEIPMMSCTNAFGTDIASVLINSFVTADPSSNFFAVKDGVVTAAFMTDEFHEGLRYVNDLVSNGLLDAASFTQTQDQLKAILNVDEAVVGVINVGALEIAFNTDVYAMNDLIYDHPVASQYQYIVVPDGPAGTHHTLYNPTMPAQLFFITKDCADPELAFKLGDQGFDPLFSKVSRHGTNGDNWTDDPEILKDYKAATIDGVTMDATWVLLDDPWGKLQNKHWYQTYPGHFTFDFNLTRGQAKDARPSKMEIIYDTYKNEVPDEYISTLVYTEDEIDELSFIQTAVNDYVKECITAFATGNMDIEKDWDRYITELKNMDVDRYLEIVQNGYDRTK